MNRKLPLKILTATLFLTLFSSLTQAADLEITCYENVKPTIARKTDPLFQLSGFLPGNSASRTIYVKNDDPNNDCRIYFDPSGTTNALTNKITVNIPTLFNDTLTKYMNSEKILMANLQPNQEITRTMTLEFPTDANNTFTLKKASFDITIISEWGPDITPEGGEIAGATDTTKDSKKSLTSFFSELLGVGEGDFENGETKENNEDEKEDESTKLVLGKEDGKECNDKTLWWIPLIAQLILTITVISVDKSIIKKKHIKLLISVLLATISYLVINRIGCGCNPVWLCTNHWILNTLIGLFPLLLYLKRRSTEFKYPETQQTL